jgi:hypothetical protein
MNAFGDVLSGQVCFHRPFAAHKLSKLDQNYYINTEPIDHRYIQCGHVFEYALLVADRQRQTEQDQRISK